MPQVDLPRADAMLRVNASLHWAHTGYHSMQHSIKQSALLSFHFQVQDLDTSPLLHSAIVMNHIQRTGWEGLRTHLRWCEKLVWPNQGLSL